MRRRQLLILRVAVTAGILPVLFGCSDKAVIHTQNGGAEQVELLDVPSDPLSAFSARSSSDFVTLQRGLEYVAKPCMQQQGFSMPSRVEVAASSHPDFTVNFSLSDDIGEFGYTGRPDKSIAVPDMPAGVDPERYSLALWGDPNDQANFVAIPGPDGVSSPTLLRGGCMGRAERQVLGDIGGLEGLRFQLESAQRDAISRVKVDARFISVVKAWSKCMSGRGFGFASPDEAISQTLGRSIDRQLTVSAADQSCRAEVAYVSVGERLLWNYERVWVESHPTIAAEYGDLWNAALARAASLVAGK